MNGHNSMGFILKFNALNKNSGPTQGEKVPLGQLFEDSFKVIRRKARRMGRMGERASQKSNIPKSRINTRRNKNKVKSKDNFNSKTLYRRVTFNDYLYSS